MAAIATIPIGRVVTCRGVLHDSAGDPGDPDGDVYIQVLPPSGTLAEFKYGVDPEVTKNSAGDYEMDVTPVDGEAGDWLYSVVGLTSLGGYWSRVIGQFNMYETGFDVPPAPP